MEEVDEQDLQVERVAALDLGKAALEACVRVPHESKPGGRLQEAVGSAGQGLGPPGDPKARRPARTGTFSPFCSSG